MAYPHLVPKLRTTVAMPSIPLYFHRRHFNQTYFTFMGAELVTQTEDIQPTAGL
jgi:hypothetical protein